MIIVTLIVVFLMFYINKIKPSLYSKRKSHTFCLLINFELANVTQSTTKKQPRNYVIRMLCEYSIPH